MRPVVTVALAVVLVGIGTSALAATAPDRTAAHLEGELDRLERAGVDIAATSAATRRLDRSARVPVTVTVPDGGAATARVERVEVGCPLSRPVGECPPWQASYRLRGGESGTVAVDGPRLRTVEEPLVLDPGEHRLRVAYLELDGRKLDSDDVPNPDEGADFTGDRPGEAGDTAVVVERADRDGGA